MISVQIVLDECSMTNEDLAEFLENVINGNRNTIGIKFENVKCENCKCT